MKFTLQDKDKGSVKDTERHLKRSTLRSILVVLAILAAAVLVWFTLGCTAPLADDEIDRAIALRIARGTR